MLADKVIFADGAHIDIVVCFADETGKPVGMGVGNDGESTSLRKSNVAILDFPSLGTAAFSPVEDYTVALEVGGREVGDIGAYIGGEHDGVAPFARVVKSLAYGLDGGIVDYIGFEAGDSAVGHIAVDNLVESGVEDMQTIAEVVFLGRPVERCFLVGDSGYMEVHGCQAGHIGAVERAGRPVGHARAVAVLAHMEYIVGHRIEIMDGVEGVVDGVVVGNPAAACGQTVPNLIGNTRVAPTERHTRGADDGVAQMIFNHYSIFLQ